MLVFSRSFQSIVLVALLGSQSAAAFQSASKARTATSLNAEAVERRDFFSQAVVTTAATLLAVGGFAVPHPALASGGATAGGAYLLSAKQRYNDRVTKGLKGFLVLEESLKAGSVKEATAYFAGVEVGTFGDISTAGYLLANAFRQSANKAPDALPSVKAWKAFVKELDAVQKKLKKKDAAGALQAYQGAKALLDPYLAEVELPSSAEL